MYLAELHGKLSVDKEDKEDLLTSNVFSFFKYVDRIIFLHRFLKLIGLEVDAQAVQKAEFLFWPSYRDGTQPDLVLLIGSYYLLIEAKFLSGFGEETQTRKHQLIREIEGGSAEANIQGRIFKLITVTADYCKNRVAFAGIPQHYLKDVIWINWQRIALLIYQILNEKPPISLETRLFAEDLYRLLVKKGLRNFEGVKVLNQAASVPHAQSPLFFQASTARYRGDFIGFIQALKDHPRLDVCPRSAFFFTPPEERWQTLSELKLSPVQSNHIFYRGKTQNG